MPDPISYQSIDQAAHALRLGERRAEFTAAGNKPRRSPALMLIPPLILFGLVLWMLASAGLLASIIGIGFIVLFVVLIGGAVAGMMIKAKDTQGDQAMHIFDEGVVILGAKGRVLPYRWDETRLVRVGVRASWESDGQARWSYGLLNAATPPVVMGQTVAFSTMIANSDGVDLGNITRAAEFERIDVWGPALEDGITRANAPRVLAELAAGRSVEFGPAAATPEGLVLGKKLTPWSEITSLRIDNGYLLVKRQGKLFRSSVLANDVPNFLVLVAVADRLGAVSLG
ncbi:hypothetical protein APR04_004591 [Promicromonospora umidemergens]|nr:DUF6585 family protein [Promicromonospora umidemergens]MCP2285656.1 hypothetical protein [Promicromonospora umidemergens]